MAKAMPAKKTPKKTPKNAPVSGGPFTGDGDDAKPKKMAPAKKAMPKKMK